MISLVVLFLLMIVLSIFFSGAEMAFVSANKLKLRELADGGDPRAQFILKLHQNAQYFLSAVLIGNNITYVISTAILTYFFRDYFGVQNEWMIMVIMAPVLIIFTEMVPKDYCRLRAIPFLLEQVFWLKWLQRLLYIPILIFFKAISLLVPALRHNKSKEIFVNEEEFRSLIDESTRQGIVGPQEERLIHTILDFERIQVQSVMIPVEQVPMVDIFSKIEDVRRIARQNHGKMILVYEEIPSIVVGMIYVFDILWEGENTRGLHDFLRAPVFMPETTSIEKAFLTLQQKRQSYAVIIDPLRNVEGVVPIERLLLFERH